MNKKLTKIFFTVFVVFMILALTVVYTFPSLGGTGF